MKGRGKLCVVGACVCLLLISAGCRTSLSNRRQVSETNVVSAASVIEDLPKIEGDIIELLGVIHRLEQARDTYIRYYKINSVKALSEVLPELPICNRANLFQYSDYYQQRKQLRDELMQYGGQLDSQLKYIRNDLTRH